MNHERPSSELCFPGRTYPKDDTEEPTAKEAAERALSCLYIAVDAAVAGDVNKTVKAYISHLEQENERLEEWKKLLESAPGMAAEVIRERALDGIYFAPIVNAWKAQIEKLRAELAQVKAELPCGVVRTSQGDFFCYYHKEHSGQHLFELVNSLRAELAQAQEENCELTGATEQASGVIEGLHAELATEREDRKAVLAAIEVARKAEGETIERLTAELAAAQQIVTATIDVLDKYCRGDATKATTPGNLAEIVEKILKSDRRAEIEAEEALSAARRLGDEALRQALFDGHGCPLKYGDDGELQCARLPMIDFKRDSITDIRLKSMIHGQKRMDEARLPEPLPSQVTSESEQK